MRFNLVENGIYNHFKGNNYTALCTADDSKCNTYVVYSDDKGNTYARPDYMFFEEINTEQHGNRQRFIFTGEKDNSAQLPTDSVILHTENPDTKFKLKQRGEGFILARAH